MGKRGPMAFLLVEYAGQEMTMKAAAKASGLSYYTLWHRRFVQQLTGEALFAPPKPPGQRGGRRKRREEGNAKAVR